MPITKQHKLTALIVLIALLLVAFKYWHYLSNPWTRDGQVRAEVIQITPRVSGAIIHVAVKDNQLVSAGDRLFTIDPRTFEASLAEAKGQYDKAVDDNLALQKQLEAAEAQVAISHTLVSQAQSGIKEIDAQLVKNLADRDRQHHLNKQRATSQRSVDQAQASYDQSLEQRQGAVAALAQSQATLQQALASAAKVKASLGAAGADNASIRMAKAQQEQAQLNLEFTQVKAPVTGYVTNLNIRTGSQAVANQPALALVDTASFWVDGFFKETLVGDFSPGDKAIVTLMTYPDIPLEGVVDSIGWGVAQQDGSTGFELLPNINPSFEWIRLAQRIPVKIRLNKVPEPIKLRVGTTASVLVKTGTHP